MNSREFSYWLQGLFEVAEPTTLNEKQVELIKRHLNMVFIHEIDLSYPTDQQEALNEAHNGNSIDPNFGIVVPSEVLNPKPIVFPQYPKGQRC